MSIRSIFPESQRSVAERQAALELGRRALGAERDLEPARHELHLGGRLVSEEPLEIRAQRVSQARPPAARSGRAGRPTRARRRDSDAPARSRPRGSRASRARSPARGAALRRSGCSVVCSTCPRSIGSGSASIFFGSITRSTSQADEQSAKRSSSVAEKTVFAASGPRAAGLRSAVARSKAPRARSSRRDQSFAAASASAPSASSAARRTRARRRSRSLGADSSGHVRADSGRRRVARCTSAWSNSARTSSQNGLGSRGTPSSPAASRTSTSRCGARVHAV